MRSLPHILPARFSLSPRTSPMHFFPVTLFPFLVCKRIDWCTADAENSTLVRNYIISTLRKLKDRFVDTTPYGPKSFTNVIAMKDPDAPRCVVLAAHFDSKFFPSYPHSLRSSSSEQLTLLDVANPLLDAHARRVEQAELGLENEDIDEYMAETTLQLIFFDGEEAFMDWSATDSIYGAGSGPLSSFLSSAHPFPKFPRHLTATWASTYLPPHPKRHLISAST